VLHDRRTDTLDVFGIDDGRLPMGVLVISTDEGIDGHCTLSFPGPDQKRSRARSASS
jgi:hypothetical protein